ncbi:hypothetical protein PR048_004643 [Dryococelus australis]|uniref:Uncharacterized protein n=1 Tax=Dryococelus australis TaxID=614101 RepID=A0ABQ9I5Y7_9NEOP|nr:hypothetical protein PR048_004643 [Dryococelus australis]
MTRAEGVHYATVWRMLNENLLYLYHIQQFQSLIESDYQQRINCENLVHILEHVLWTYGVAYNTYQCVDENPHTVLNVTLTQILIQVQQVMHQINTCIDIEEAIVPYYSTNVRCATNRVSGLIRQSPPNKWCLATAEEVDEKHRTRHWSGKPTHQVYQLDSAALYQSGHELRRLAFKTFNVPQIYLRWLDDEKYGTPEEAAKCRHGRSTVLNPELEQQLVDYCLRMQSTFYGLTPTDMKRMANIVEDIGMLGPLGRTRGIARTDSIQYATVWRILKENLLYPYQIQRDLAFTVSDCPRWMVLFVWLWQQCENVVHAQEYVLWMNEPTFTRDGVIKVRSAYQREEVNRHAIQKLINRHQFSLNTWGVSFNNLSVSPFMIPWWINLAHIQEFPRSEIPMLLEVTTLYLRKAARFIHDANKASKNDELVYQTTIPANQSDNHQDQQTIITDSADQPRRHIALTRLLHLHAAILLVISAAARTGRKHPLNAVQVFRGVPCGPSPHHPDRRARSLATLGQHLIDCQWRVVVDVTDPHLPPCW